MYDLIIKNGTVADGTGRPACTADVFVNGDTIADIRQHDASDDGRTVIDAAGLTVSPGFIDIHSHSDTTPFSDHLCDSKLQQGVTTEICGNCGSSPTPSSENENPDENDDIKKICGSVSSYAGEVDRRGYVTNIGCLIGHGTLRSAVMGKAFRDPTEDEMSRMEALLDRELGRGAFGISLGLIYPPSAFAGYDELVRLAKVTAHRDGMLAVHMRNEGSRVFESVKEMLSIARDSGVRLEISHLKLVGKPQWGRAEELLSLIETARADGMRVNCDQYPFCASHTSLKALLPHWAQDGGGSRLTERLLAPADKLKSEIAEKLEERGGPAAVMICRASKCPQYNNRYLEDIMAETGMSAPDTVIRLLLENKNNISCLYFCMNEDDVTAIMPKKYISVGTDSSAVSFDTAVTTHSPHPRVYSTYPCFFRTVRERGLCTLEEAVFKCTALPASVLGIKDRGVLAPGMKADITVFDSATITETSRYTESRSKPDGIKYVFVNGRTALCNKKVTDSSAGRAILKQ